MVFYKRHGYLRKAWLSTKFILQKACKSMVIYKLFTKARLFTESMVIYRKHGYLWKGL